MSGPKVVQLPQRPSEPAVQLLKQDYESCPHHRFRVDRDQPRCFCADCDELLDPYFVLRRVANSHLQRHYRVDEMKSTAERLEKQARRQQAVRRSQDLKERDERSIQHYQKIQALPPERFPGDVAIVEGEG